MGRTALAEFIEANYARMVFFVRNKLEDKGSRDSEDIVQDVMLNLVDGLAVTDPIVNISAYVFRALKNRIIDEYRKPKCNTSSLDEEQEDQLSLYDILPDLKYDPKGSFKREQLHREISEAIESLPESQQEAIIETEFNGISIRELARRSGTPQGTILARKHRGLRTIQEKFSHIKEEYHGTC